MKLQTELAEKDRDPKLQKIAQDFEANFRWEYDDGRESLLKLYRKGKRQQWDSDTRIDWSQDLDPENPAGMPDEMIAIYGSPVWNRLDEKGRTRIRHHVQAWQLSQFLHGEQGAHHPTAQHVTSVKDHDSNLYASSQVVDEARHHVFFDRFMREGRFHRALDQLHDVLRRVRFDLIHLHRQAHRCSTRFKE